MDCKFVALSAISCIVVLIAIDDWIGEQNLRQNPSNSKRSTINYHSDIGVGDQTNIHPFGNIYIKLEVFYDDKLLNRFNREKDRLELFIMSISHSVSLWYNNPPIGRLARFHFVILNISPLYHAIRIDSSADGEKYRQQFRQHYTKKLLDQNSSYSVALLLTGHNFRYLWNRTGTQGLATAGFVACNKRSDKYVIIEARSYRAAFIMAHEIGHTMNMYHDEDFNMHHLCNSNYIMSFSTGPGKNKFSICSYNSIHEYLKKMDSYTRKCFKYKPNKPFAMFPDPLDQQMANFPANHYKSVSLDEQCQMALGRKFKAKDMTYSLISVCKKIECTNHFINIFIDPALENSSCGKDRYCRAGHCL